MKNNQNNEKVFSIQAFITDCQKKYSKEEINYFLNSWALECDGLTKNEMLGIGYITKEDWMVETNGE